MRINKKHYMILEKITKLGIKVTLFTDVTHLLQLFSVGIAGLHQYYGCTIAETKLKVRTK